MRKKKQPEFCTIEGCEGKKAIAFGWCWMHYARAKRNKSMELKKKSIICKHCHAPRYTFKGGESNLCKNHISIYRKERYQRLKNLLPSSGLDGISAKARLTVSEETSKTSADDSISSRGPISENQTKEENKQNE